MKVDIQIPEDIGQQLRHSFEIAAPAFRSLDHCPRNDSLHARQNRKVRSDPVHAEHLIHAVRKKDHPIRIQIMI